MLSYSEEIDCAGIRIPFLPDIITPVIERPLRNGRYEGGERAALRTLLQAGDRVLELGAGLGLLSTVAAQRSDVASVTAVEANPGLIPLIRETHRLNGTGHVDLRHGVVTADPGDPMTFYLRPDFWASSLTPRPRAYVGTAEVPRVPLPDLIAELRPTVIVCDIEGGEAGLFDAVDLSGVRAIIIEFHERVYGEAGRAAIEATFTRAGLSLSDAGAGSTVRYFERPAPAPSLLPPRPFRDPPPARDPRVFVATCMKDEGPFILEWIAWHRSMGITDIAVFTNDCSDGTDRILDRLMDLGHVLHLPNPALPLKEPALQPSALNYAHFLRPMREADYFISMDVDEFINVRPGQGHLNDLFAAVGPFDVLSMTEVNHGANQTEGFTPGWMTEQFPLHGSVTPGPRRARRGVKSIVRLSPLVERLRNHRPDMFSHLRPLTWLDGSGRPQPTLPADRGENGLDCRGTYDLVRLEHYPLRSLESYLAKMFRGDVVVANKRVSRTYWRSRNRNEEDSANFGLRLTRAHSWYDEHLAGDRLLMDLHRAACAAHAARIADLLHQPDFRDRRDWILSEAWVS